MPSIILGMTLFYSNMVLKTYYEVIKESPIIHGFDDINEVVNNISSTHHSILLSGYLLYSYKGSDSIKSVIITTGRRPEVLMISVFYETYSMIYTALSFKGLESFIDDIKDNKKLKDLYESLVSRFYKIL